MKKLLSLLLCLTMLISMVPGLTFADEAEPAASETQEQLEDSVMPEDSEEDDTPDEDGALRETLEPGSEAENGDAEAVPGVELPDTATDDSIADLPEEPQGTEGEDAAKPSETPAEDAETAPEGDQAPEMPTEEVPDAPEEAEDPGMTEPEDPGLTSDPETPVEPEDLEEPAETGEAPEETGEDKVPPEEDVGEEEKTEDGEEDADEEEEGEVFPQSTRAEEILTVSKELGTIAWSLPTLDGGLFTQETYADKILVVVGVTPGGSNGKGGAFYDELVQSLDAATWTRMDGVQVVVVSTGPSKDETKAKAFADQITALSLSNARLLYALYGNSMLYSLLHLGTAEGTISGFCAVIAGGMVHNTRKACFDAEDVAETVAAYTGESFFDTAPPVELGLNVAYHSEEEIAAFLNEVPSAAVVSTYAAVPSLKEPYSAGELSEATQQNAVNLINQIRYIAGLNADVTINPEYSELAQAAVLLNRLNGGLSHYPARPAVLSDAKYDELYTKGSTGASKSNLFRSTAIPTLTYAMLNGWMADDDSGNIQMVGHRRWVLSPTLGSTGFGQVDGCCAMYALGGGGSGTQTNIAWPAQNTPMQFFNAGYPWSLSVGTLLDAEKTTVTLTRQADQKVWSFSSTKSDGDFYVNNGNYGLKGCVIFRPKDLGNIMPTDSFDVEVNTVIYGSTKVRISYTVNFFNIHVHNTEIKNAREATCSQEGYTGDQVCKICGRTIAKGVAIAKLPHTPGRTVRETVKEPTCTEEGSCSEIVYCKVCGEVASRELKPIPAAHKPETRGAKPATPTEKGYTGDEVCTVCGETVSKGTEIPSLSETQDFPPVTGFRFDRDYLLLLPGESDELTPTGLPEAWVPYLIWSVQDADGAENDTCLALSKDGSFYALQHGTAYVTATVTDLEGTSHSARCRVDVLDSKEQGQTEIDASLLQTKFTVELRKTEYTRIPVVLDIKQNLKTQYVTTDAGEEFYDTGMMIAEAWFEGDADNPKKDICPVFGLRIADDRYLEIIPIIDVTDPDAVKAVAGSYKSVIHLELNDGTGIDTVPVTVTVKKSQPKLTAKPVTVNSFISDQTVPVEITGGTVSSVPAQDLDFATLNSDLTVTVKPGYTKNASKTVTLNVQPDDWAVATTLKITVKNQYKAPKIALKPTTVTVNKAHGDVAAAAVAVTPLKGINHVISAEGVSNLNAWYDESTESVMVSAGSAGVGNYKVPVKADGNTVAFLTVKVVDGTPSITAKVTGAIDKAVDYSPAVITVTGKNYNAASGTYKVEIKQNGEKVDSDLFRTSQNGNVISITAGTRTPADGKYTATVSCPEAGEAKPAVFTVKTSKQAPAMTATLKAAGSIDILRGTGQITVTPTIKNEYDYEETDLSLKLPKGLTSVYRNGRFVVTAVPGADIDPNDKTVTLKLKGTEIPKAKATLQLKQGKVTVNQSTKTVMLSKNDRFDRQSVILSLSDSTLNGIRKVNLTGGSGAVTLIPLGSGEYAIGYAKNNKGEHVIPDAVSSGKLKSTTVKLNVFLEGNGGTKANATLSVKVSFS
ncbi:MAG: hypothetical protein K6C12_06575 [Oscillospiraceae bacterium]|nr:hypothetical protein [Oscillospiraceae bacterium]